MSAPPPPTGASTFVDGRFLDPESGEVVEGDLRVENGRIVAMGVVDRTDSATVELGGRMVVPGLIDAHFHAYASGMGGLGTERRLASFVAINAVERLKGALRRGFTTVRDPAGGDAGLARAITDGLVRVPRYLYTGPALSQTGGHGDPREPDVDVCFTCGHLCEVVDGVDAMRKAARERLRVGAHAIKVMTSGGISSPTDPLRPPQYSDEELCAVADEARRRHSYVAAHAYSPEAILHSVRNGVRSIEHGNLLDDASAAAMREHGAFLVPTLGAYDAIHRRADELGLPGFARRKNDEVLEAGCDSLKVAGRHGLPIGFGSDNMGELVGEQLCGIPLHLRVRTPLAVLQSLTCVNADLIRRDDLGRLRVGAVADLLVLAGDPLSDPDVLWDEARPRSVVQAGRVTC
ncbi:amidohydrolase family protein [Actinoallomurus oryzae]|jgi:imidazolonepropionase-like amidohydrolase|uniref:Amidohydrolase family protein n=1 Tax=Actinoallomurus oryzae TaxID=502180 RepID=A0ABP8PX20_9ACTN